MKKYLPLIAGIIGIILMAITARAADKTISWDAVPEAAGYRLTLSTDMGVTWVPATPISDFMAPITQAVIDIPDGVLVLIRAGAYNNIGEAINTTTGVWFNSAWLLTAVPLGLRTPGE